MSFLKCYVNKVSYFSCWREMGSVINLEFFFFLINQMLYFVTVPDFPPYVICSTL